MKKTKLTIDLGNIQLDEDQQAALLAAIHKTVAANVKQKAVAPVPKARSSTAESATLPAAQAVKDINVGVEFKNVNPGLSAVTATIQGQKGQLTQSGDIPFTGVTTPGVLLVIGKSLGTTTVTIDQPATPQTKTFAPGTFRFIFKLS